MTVAELRGPCGHLIGKLDPEQGIVQTACRWCSREEGRRVVHWFAAADGTPLETIKPYMGELGDEKTAKRRKMIN